MLVRKKSYLAHQRALRPKRSYASAHNQSSIVAARIWLFLANNLNRAQNKLCLLAILFAECYNRFYGVEF